MSSNTDAWRFRYGSKGSRVSLLLCLLVALSLSSTLGQNVFSVPCKLPYFNVRNITTGGYSTAIITRDHEVFWWGHGTSTPQKLLFPDHIRDVKCGGYHCLALSDKGKVYQWGQVDGMGRTPVTSPQLVEGLSSTHVVKISAGYQHNIAIDDEGNVYSWGETLYGKLGRSLDPSKQRDEAGKIHLPGNVPIVDGCAGGDHTILLDGDGSIYTCGSNRDGQLGHGDDDTDLVVPLKVRFSTPERITKISCGGDHSLVLNEDGEVHSWGSNEFGQLGHGHLLPLHEPKKLSVDEKIVHISGGGFGHSFLIAESGNIYSMGWSESYQTGTGSNANLEVPTLVSTVPGSVKVLDIPSGGYKHAAVLCDNGDVYLFGENTQGQLGPIGLDSIQLSEKTFGRDNNIYVYLNHSSTTEFIQDKPSFPYVGLSSTQNRREYQEDTAVYVPNFMQYTQDIEKEEEEQTTNLSEEKCAKKPVSVSFVGVFDGHAGGEVSTFLAKNYHSQLHQVFDRKNITKSFLDAHQRLEILLNNVETNGGYTTIPSGSTSLACLIIDEQEEWKIACANAGDSLAYIGSSGNFHPLSETHRPGNLREYQRVTDLGGRILNNRVSGSLAVTRSFGDYMFAPYVTATPFVKVQSFGKDVEWLVLGSDGLWDDVPPSTVFQALSSPLASIPEEDKPQAYSQSLLQAAIENDSSDNITIILINLKNLKNQHK
eukprot:TRINITY_DN5535_c0_g1_i1.p1 TRINITY_DN5535_c0_g1~~TRINITY_DN5535_c0_g1_i1.p1  ORF type:complete len:709 (-),score=152.40 TRINITY_DN5535_c0_g1_i1:15-2141(-)